MAANATKTYPARGRRIIHRPRGDLSRDPPSDTRIDVALVPCPRTSNGCGQRPVLARIRDASSHVPPTLHRAATDPQRTAPARNAISPASRRAPQRSGPSSSESEHRGPSISPPYRRGSVARLARGGNPLERVVGRPLEGGDLAIARNRRPVAATTLGARGGWAAGPFDGGARVRDGTAVGRGADRSARSVGLVASGTGPGSDRHAGGGRVRVDAGQREFQPRSHLGNQRRIPRIRREPTGPHPSESEAATGASSKPDRHLGRGLGRARRAPRSATTDRVPAVA